MMMPCIVKNLLYVSDSDRGQAAGSTVPERIRPANAPPIKKKNVIEMRYSIAIRL